METKLKQTTSTTRPQVLESQLRTLQAFLVVTQLKKNAQGYPRTAMGR